MNKVIFFHGNPSCFEEFEHMLPVFLKMQYQCFAFDLPGFGGSPGKAMAGRSEKVLIEGGPAELIRLFINRHNLTNLVAVGYDWGGTIAIKMAIKFPKLFKKIIVLCPSYTEEDNELTKLSVPILVMWCAEDRMHSWKKFRPLCKKIKKCTEAVFNVKPYKEGASASAYAASSEKMTVPIFKFLTGTDPLKDALEVQRGTQEVVQSTHGRKAIQINTVMLKEDLDDKNMDIITKKTDFGLLAANEIKKIYETG